MAAMKNLARSVRLHLQRPTSFEKLTLDKREAGVYREIKPAPDTPPASDTIGSFVAGWFKSDFISAAQRIQTFWSSSINVMGPNLRFAAEMMNPVITAIAQAPSTIFGKAPDPMSKMASIMSEVILARQPSQGIHMGR
jgi:hypothetical protein